MILQFQPRPGILDLGWGHPAAEALPADAWTEATAEALRAYGSAALTYGYGPGPAPLVEWLGEPAATTFVTAGASQALDVISRLLTAPGDLAIVDSPTYHLAMRILSGHGVDLAAAPADAEGIVPEAVAELVAERRRSGRTVSVLYLVPTFGNPTGRNLSTTRRLELLRVARDTGLTIIEDDTYRELAFEEPAPPSMWSLAEAGEVIRVGSFAKTVAPGLRLGWINAEPSFVGRLTDLGYVDSGGGVNHTVAMIMSVFGRSGAYRQHVDDVRRLYADRRDILVTALRAALPELPVPSPGGGWFIWLPLRGASARALLPVAEDLGVSFMPGSRFFADERGDDHVRLSFSMLAPAELEEAARRFGTAVGALT